MLTYISAYLALGILIFVSVFTNIKATKEVLPLQFRLLPILVAFAWPIILLSVVYDVMSKFFTSLAEKLIKLTHRPKFKVGDIVKYKEPGNRFSLSRLYLGGSVPPNTFLTVIESNVNLYGDTLVKLTDPNSNHEVHADEDDLEIVSEEEIVLYGK